MLFRDTDQAVRRQSTLAGLDQLRVGNVKTVKTIKAANTSGGRAGREGSRASVYEAHHGNVGKVMSQFRDLGHKITKVENYDYSKSPHAPSRDQAKAGMLMRSVLHHRSGNNNLKTSIKTQFNMDGGDHHVKVETGRAGSPRDRQQEVSPSEEQAVSPSVEEQTASPSAEEKESPSAEEETATPSEEEVMSPSE